MSVKKSKTTNGYRRRYYGSFSPISQEFRNIADDSGNMVRIAMLKITLAKKLRNQHAIATAYASFLWRSGFIHAARMNSRFQLTNWFHVNS
jgi:hypothetical protein